MGGRLCMISAVAALSVGLAASCSRPASPPPAPEPPAAAPPASVVPAASPAPAAAPSGPPDYVGVVERVRVRPRPAPVGRPAVMVLVRYTQVGRPPDRIWAHLDDAVLEQNGAHLEPGSAVRLWAPGPVATSEPGQVTGVYIMCEPAGK